MISIVSEMYFSGMCACIYVCEVAHNIKCISHCGSWVMVKIYSRIYSSGQTTLYCSNE